MKKLFVLLIALVLSVCAYAQPQGTPGTDVIFRGGVNVSELLSLPIFTDTPTAGRARRQGSMIRVVKTPGDTTLWTYSRSGWGRGASGSDTLSAKVGLFSQSATVGTGAIVNGAYVYDFGNSIGAGQNATNSFYYWVNISARAMGWIEVNYSIGGSRLYAGGTNTMNQVRTNLPVYDGKSYFRVAQGTNDITTNDSVSYRDSMIVLIQYAKSKGYPASHIIVVGTYFWGLNVPQTDVNSRANQAAATAEGTKFIEMNKTILALGGLALIDPTDHIHYTSVGHTVLAQNFLNQMQSTYSSALPGYGLFYGNIRAFGRFDVGGGIRDTGDVDITYGALKMHPANTSPYYKDGLHGPDVDIPAAFSDRGFVGTRANNLFTGHAYSWVYDIFRNRYRALVDSTEIFGIDMSNGQVKYRGNQLHQITIYPPTALYDVSKTGDDHVWINTASYGDITMRFNSSPDSGETHSFENFCNCGGTPTYSVTIDGNSKPVAGAAGTYTTKVRFITLRYTGSEWIVISDNNRFRDVADIRNTELAFKTPVVLYPRTLAQLNALTSISNGGTAFCSDCKTISGYTGANVQFNGTKWEVLTSLDSNRNFTYRGNGTKIIQGIANNFTIVRGVIYSGTDPDNPGNTADNSGGLQMRGSSYYNGAIFDNSIIGVGLEKNIAPGQRLKGSFGISLAGVDTGSNNALPAFVGYGSTQNIGSHWRDGNFGSFMIGRDPAVAGLAKLDIFNIRGTKPAVRIDNDTSSSDILDLVSAGMTTGWLNRIVTTTDATPTTIATIPLASTKRVRIEVSMQGTNIPDDLYGVKSVLIRNNSGTLTPLGTLSNVVTTQSDVSLATASFTITTSGTNAIVQVTGVAATTINWKANIKYIVD